ncbi:hypothetical protein CXX78_00205 [Candidatus Parvarchaeota archaeon]|nr:MAG: hypothetical protein CXX78_01220 [Candidatus Parvarchaeota archaeon]PXY71595.1 MAG: hypothetical protein CXX78_00205 [Candidatus Parvarchaeota archaeon]
MREEKHIIEILKTTQKALKQNNSSQLQELSNKTIHSASIYQHTDLVLIAILIYSLSKISMKREALKIKNYPLFVEKINLSIEKAIKELRKKDYENFLKYLKETREKITKITPNLEPYIKDVFKKASINKASKIYEHGISLEQTAKLLGVTQWELVDYIGQKQIADEPYNLSANIKRRAELALKFLK